MPSVTAAGSLWFHFGELEGNPGGSQLKSDLFIPFFVSQQTCT